MLNDVAVNPGFPCSDRVNNNGKRHTFRTPIVGLVLSNGQHFSGTPAIVLSFLCPTLLLFVRLDFITVLGFYQWVLFGLTQYFHLQLFWLL